MQINHFRNIYLYFVGLIIISMIVLVYINWHELLTTSQHWQRTFHSSLTTFLLKVKSDPFNTGAMLIGLSFLYGIVHSAGPGHGKVIITTYLATQPTQFKKSLRLTFLSALMQGTVAVGLISMLVIVLNLSPKKIYLSEYWLQFASYIMVILIGLFICYRTIKKIIKSRDNSIKTQLKIYSVQPIPLDFKAINHQINSSISCSCCNHRHLPTTQEIEKSAHWYTDLAIIISIGLRPCSGALLVLIFAYVIDVYSWGIAATLAMSLGTALTTSTIALLVYYARQLAQHQLKYTSSKYYYLLKQISSLIIIIGGVLFIGIGLLLLFGMDIEAGKQLNPVIG